MKIKFKFLHHSKNNLLFTAVLIFMLLNISVQSSAQNSPIIFNKEAKQQNATISDDIKIQLIECENTLNYPQSVKRFYEEKNDQLIWVEKGNHNRQLAPAMMILDCVLQFGLNPLDFHPNELIYDQIKIFTEQPEMLSDVERAKFDILLTDAMITFMNHLHYGKFNTVFTRSKIDAGGLGNFSAENHLSKLMESNDFYTEIINVQPNTKEYDDLQKYMHLVRGQYVEDSYEFPEKSVRKMTINMERLRWLTANENPRLMINIPAYTAKLKLKDNSYLFEVIVGKPSSPTPVLESAITHFTVAPDWKVPSKIFVKELLPKAIKNIDYLANNHYAIYDAKGKFVEITLKKLKFIKAHPFGYFVRQSSGCDNALGKIVFRFANPYDVYLHDTPQPKLFLSAERALSHGCIRIDDVEKLASLLLANDGASTKIPLMKKAVLAYKKQDFLLKNPLPIKLTYVTCELVDSQLIIYNDIYNLDRGLEIAMYGAERLLASDQKIFERK
ncbi:L,D-transpeptidase [Pedobacter changchengzhani]|uniref:L,D-transpeptidase n=1 Tax=Pedobacter changchengzhani TaxID=2529274 RepID=A0A4R5MLV9_9SPHI|nr:L,D-transpeptidase family protein [Pedobacter changchengzhani]TDG36486.1 L,D-transpeptidase [Pedobacter changchengzhani]